MPDTFPPDVERFVQQELASARYGSRDELVLDALRLLRDSKGRFQQLREDIKQQLDLLDRGEGIELDDDEALAGLFDDIETEVDREMASGETETP